MPPRDWHCSGLVSEVVMFSSDDFSLGGKHWPAFGHKAGGQLQTASRRRGGVMRRRGLSSDRVPSEDIAGAIELVERILERRHAVLGNGLRRPPFAAVHRAKRTVLA